MIPTFLATKLNLLPILLPFFTPFEGQSTTFANLWLKAILILGDSRHGSILCLNRSSEGFERKETSSNN